MVLKWLKILPIFGRNKEKETVELFKFMMKEIVDARAPFKEVGKALKKGDFKKVAEFSKVIREHEHKCDKLRRQISQNLYLGAFMPAMRTRLYDLTDTIDSVMDSVQDAVDRMVYLEHKKVPPKVLDIYIKMIDEACRGIAFLSLIMDNLYSGSHDLMANIKKANLVEHNLDELKKEVLDIILFDKKLNPVCVLVSWKVSKFLAEIGDCIERCCDDVSVLRLMRQP
ncbi:MAG: DUF47 family protein [Nanoarchaeota archaeon]|nr:DUF47 family protein [Nanoarchaeota archaeon]